jgi:hypothetical protein
VIPRVVPASLLVLAAAPAAAQSTVDYRVSPVADPAGLTGTVVFTGDVPRARRFLITKDVEVCGLGYRERQEVEVSGDGGLTNVVVAVVGVEAGKPWAEPAGGWVLNQEGCVFDPHLQVVPRGQALNILNPDPVLHNVHGFELIGTASRTLFNFGQPPEQPTITHAVRPRRSNRIRLECDAHDFMLGWVYAADTPYAVAVDGTGRFVIDDIPPGTYTVIAWHPYLGVQEQRVTLAPNGTGDVTFQYVAE